MSPSHRSLAADWHVTGGRSVQPAVEVSLHVVYECEQSRVYGMPADVSIATWPSHRTIGDGMAGFHQHPSSWQMMPAGRSVVMKRPVHPFLASSVRRLNDHRSFWANSGIT